jgi:uncharacterized repeat protein (TIGR03837 family)
MGGGEITIDLLCKVVDNYGDIGVAFRLARALSALPERPSLRLVVDDRAAFAALDPEIDPAALYQRAHGWEVLGWRLPAPGEAGAEEAARSLRERPPRYVVECFACGRPDWLEALLFDPEAGPSVIVDLEHLTAERYAVELHRMPSLTRSAKVKKAMFLPGFLAGTGGLVMDSAFGAASERVARPGGREGLRRELLSRIGEAPRPPTPGAEAAFWVTVFGYGRDYGRVVADLAAFHEGRAKGEGGPLVALAAAGKSGVCFMDAWEKAGRPFPVVELPFLPQETWDELLLAGDFSIVRGEDSWSRAALAGRPFLWQAYPQEDRYQMVKVRAFLDCLRPRFSKEEFAPLEGLYLAFNDRDRDEAQTRGEEALGPVLERYALLFRGFRAFSEDLAERGSLASDLLTFLREML